MVTTFQIKKIHTLKNLIGMGDDLYREILKSFDVQTSKNLTFTEASIVIENLEERAIALNKWVKQSKKYAGLNRTNNMACKRLQQQTNCKKNEFIFVKYKNAKMASLLLSR